MATATKQSYHDRRVQRRLTDDPEYREEHERALRQIHQIDALVNELDELRESEGISKAELARAIGKDPASVRRFFSAQVNPELKTVAAIADALNAEVVIKPLSTRKRPRSKAKSGRATTISRERALAA